MEGTFKSFLAPLKPHLMGLTAALLQGLHCFLHTVEWDPFVAHKSKSCHSFLDVYGSDGERMRLYTPPKKVKLLSWMFLAVVKRNRLSNANEALRAKKKGTLPGPEAAGLDRR